MTETVRANGLDFCLETAGEGPPLLFLGGTGWDLRRNRLPLSPPLTRHFSVALYDQRGQGRSAKPPGPYKMLDYARDAVGVLDALGWQCAHVIGYSFGGMVAQELAIGWPDRVQRMVLAATTSGGAGGASYPIHEFADLPPEARALKGLEVADLRFTSEYRSAYPAKAQTRISARAAAQAQFNDEPGAREGLQAQLSARATHDTYSRLGSIASDTLVVAGEFDGQAPMQYVREVARTIPNSVFDTVLGPHDFINECPDFFDKAIAFLRNG